MPMVDYIEISGYKSIKQQRIDLAPVNILIGANGSGKSNFISFFSFLNWLYEQKMREYVALVGGVDKILHKGMKNTQQLAFKVVFENHINAYEVDLKVGSDGFFVEKEWLWYEKDARNIASFLPEARIKYSDMYRAAYIRDYLEGLRRYHFHDTGMHAPFSKMSHVENDAYFLYADGSNLASFLYRIRDRNFVFYKRIVDVVQSIAPYFSDFFLQPNEEGYVRLQWTDKFSEIIYGPADFSDGTIRFVALVVLFMQPDLPNTIVIDEPELGLHPAAIAKLAGMIKSATSKGCQVIVATQSVELINHFEPEDILVVDQISGQSEFKRLNNESFADWLEDYTLGELWTRNIISSGQPNY